MNDKLNCKSDYKDHKMVFPIIPIIIIVAIYGGSAALGKVICEIQKSAEKDNAKMLAQMYKNGYRPIVFNTYSSTSPKKEEQKYCRRSGLPLYFYDEFLTGKHRTVQYWDKYYGTENM